MKQFYVTIFGLAELFKTRKWPGPARLKMTIELFDNLFLGKYIREVHEILTQFSFQFSILAIKIWDQYL